MDEVLNYSRRVLLCVTGLTPQVVTETLYALFHNAPNELPTEIHLITTANGRNRARRDLLDPIDGKFHQFCKEFNIVNKIDFQAKNIHVIRGRYDEELPDIRTPQENECAADLIMKIVRDFCVDSQLQLHVSIAGGRKSMGFLVGYALSIYGREQDKLSHVLTSEPFENNKDFFYPSKLANPIYAQDGSALDPMQAQVALAEIPLVKLRTGLTQEFLNSNVSYSETIALAQKYIAPTVSLRFDTKVNTVYLDGDKAMKLPNTLFAVYFWFARLQKANALPYTPLKESDVEDFLTLVRKLYGKDSNTVEKLEKAFKKDPLENFKTYIGEKRTRINTRVMTKVGVDRASHYRITSNNKRNRELKYTLNIAAEQIELA